MADLPPLHRQNSNHNLTMNDCRLPPIAALVSSPPRESLHQRPPDASWTPLHHPANDALVSSASPPLDTRWNAVNNPPAPSCPTTNSSSTLTSILPHFQRPTEPSHPHSPPHSLPREVATASRPINARRQDSAVSHAPVSHPPTILEKPPSLAARNFTSIPSSLSSARAHDPDARPEPPPSPAASSLTTDASSSHSTRHDIRTASPPAPGEYDMTAASTSVRPRALSDSCVSPSSRPTTSAHVSRSTAVESVSRGNMAPPPNPSSSTYSTLPSSRTQGSDLSSIINPSPTPVHQRKTTECDSNADQLPISLSASEPSNLSTFTQARVSQNERIMPAPYLDDGSSSSTPCLHCGAVWTYPPIGETKLTQTTPPETTQDMSKSMWKQTDLDRMAQSTELLRNHMQQYDYSRTQAYMNWARQHQTLPDQPEATIPCMFPRDDAPEVVVASNKRKSYLPPEDGHVYTKFRRLSCSSPPQTTSQLTPPPDQPLSSSPQHNVAHPESKHIHSNNLEPTSHIARILYGDPRKQTNGASSTGSPDTGGMFELPESRKSVERERSRSHTPIK